MVLKQLKCYLTSKITHFIDTRLYSNSMNIKNFIILSMTYIIYLRFTTIFEKFDFDGIDDIDN